jgi:CRISPR/Cas system-associated exonuclease Cas4 (RecB family)
VSDLAALFRTPSVASWASPPKRWSYSSFTSATDCPLRWSLERSKFRFDSNEEPRRYPRFTFFGTLRGTVVHETIDRLMRELRKRGLRSVFDSRAPEALRELGGISSVAQEVAATELQRLVENPRAAGHVDAFSARLERQLQEITSEVKRAVRRTNSAPTPRSEWRSEENRVVESVACSDGEWSEVELAPQQFPWIGVADHLSVSGDSVSISDYKTGAVDDSHRTQLELYALLWSEDSVKNPAGLLATTLRIVYTRSSRVEEFPGLTPGRLDELNASYSERASEATEQVLRTPPVPKVSPDACRFCGVRQLCSDYWRTPTRRLDDPTRGADLRVALTKALSPSLWEVAVLASADLPFGTSLSMRTPAEYAEVLSAGAEVLALAYNLNGFSWDQEEAYLTVGEEAFLDPSPQSELFEPPKEWSAIGRR